jgi:hypothetical protein
MSDASAAEDPSAADDASSAGPESGDADRHPIRERVRSLDGGRIASATLALVAAAVALLVADGLFPFRSLNHDEGVYLQQAELLLHGRLFLRPPVPEAFRPWFFVEDPRGMYSKYAPVPAAAFALGKLAGGYPLALAGIAAGLVAGTVALGRELFDARVGVLAGVLLLATPLFVVHSGVFLPYALTTALNVAFAVWYLRGERRSSARDAALAGVAVGLAFFARPYTAVLFALPFVCHAVVTLFTTDAWRVPFVAPGGDDGARGCFRRRVVTAALGATGVAVTLAYNAVVTGDPLVFPYLAFAPDDGIGFGFREILGHEIVYTPELGVRSNALVLADLFGEWVVAGWVGTATAAVGVLVALAAVGHVVDVEHERASAARVRRGLLAATFAIVAAGNVAFWGNHNVLGRLNVDADGLIHYLGPYYHFDLVVPTAVFAAVGLVAVGEGVLTATASLAGDSDVDADRVRVATLAGLLVVAAAGGGPVAAGSVDEAVERNADVTDELRAGYGPLVADGEPGAGVPEDALVFLPKPYGPWLNHPFQALRNDARYEDERVYALGDTGELAVADAFPERDIYRYVYVGSWVPTDESTVRGDVRRVERIAGGRIVLDATLDRPASVETTTVRVTGERGSTYLVATDSGGPLALSMTIEGDRLAVSGESLSATEGDGTLELDDSDEVAVEAFVATGPTSGYSYQVVFPVGRDDDGTITALSPTVERCPVPTRCVPQGVGETPPDRGVDVTLSNGTAT